MITQHYYLQAPTVITTTDLGASQELRDKWAEEAYNLGALSYKTNLQTQMSSYHVWQETKVYNELLDALQNTINKTHNTKSGVYDDSAYYIDEAWSVVYRENDYAKTHSHNRFHLAFCYYIKVGNNTSELVFDDLEFTITPKNDMLVIFDASLRHSVAPHVGEDRIVFAGNCSIRGK